MGKKATVKQVRTIRDLCSELGLVIADEVKRFYPAFDGILENVPSVAASVLIGCLLEETAEKRAYFRSAREAKFNRCNASKPCKICGKKKYCSETGNGEFAVCTKESAGSILTTKNGHFVHALTTKYQPSQAGSAASTARAPVNVPRPKPVPPPLSAEQAERLSHRKHLTYQSLIALSPSTLESAVLLYGPGGLSERCLLDTAASYGAMPAAAAARASLARKIISSVAERDRSLVSDAALPGNPVAGVPGFWTDTAAGFTLWWRKDQKGPSLIIPYVDLRGRINGCQLRIPHAPKDQRYLWLSSVPMEEDGPSPGSPIHVVQTTISPDGSPREALITEGALKAECVALFLKPYTIMATAGVSCSHDEILSACLSVTRRERRVVIAFDSDHRKNKEVVYQMASLIARLSSAGLAVFILTWPETHKGLDDALLATADGRVINFALLKPLPWYTSLPEDPPEIRERAQIPLRDLLERRRAA